MWKQKKRKNFIVLWTSTNSSIKGRRVVNNQFKLMVKSNRLLYLCSHYCRSIMTLGLRGYICNPMEYAYIQWGLLYEYNLDLFLVCVI